MRVILRWEKNGLKQEKKYKKNNQTINIIAEILQNKKIKFDSPIHKKRQNSSP